MHAEVIAVGTELTSGAKLDTNSQWLSLELAAIGIPVHFHTTVADEMDAMLGVLRDAINRSDVVLISGGLGPTLDDLTRQALAEVMQVELELHQASLDFIKSLFERRNLEMPKRNDIQAMFPRGSEVIPNTRGTAPGIWVEISRKTSPNACLIAAMPGVPSEMKKMFHRDVLPKLPGGQNVIKRARVNCFGVGESTAEEMLGELTARGRDPDVGITVHEATITLRITSQGRTPEECDAKIDTAKASIREIMGELVFGEEDDELEHIVVRLLSERGLTLATAESGTGGLLANRLTTVKGFEKCYLGGLVVPALAAKGDVVGVDANTLAAHGAASSEAAAKMATTCRARFGTDFALSITENPRFNPDDTNAKVPSAYVALAGDGLSKIREFVLIGDDTITRSRAAKVALNLLRLHLQR